MSQHPASEIATPLRQLLEAVRKVLLAPALEQPAMVAMWTSAAAAEDEDDFGGAAAEVTTAAGREAVPIATKRPRRSMPFGPPRR